MRSTTTVILFHFIYNMVVAFLMMIFLLFRFVSHVIYSFSLQEALSWRMDIQWGRGEVLVKFCCMPTSKNVHAIHSTSKRTSFVYVQYTHIATKRHFCKNISVCIVCLYPKRLSCSIYVTVIYLVLVVINLTSGGIVIILIFFFMTLISVLSLFGACHLILLDRRTVL